MTPLVSIPLGITGAAGILLLGYYQLSSIASKSANREDENGIWIVKREGEARSVIRNGTHIKTIMAYRGHTIGRKEGLPLVGDGFDDEYVVPETPPAHPRLHKYLQRMNWFQGIAFVGVLKGTELYRGPFAWMSFKRGLMSDNEKPFKQHEEKPFSYLYVQPAIYVFKMSKVEVAGEFPHDIWILVTIQVTNPARAFHRIPAWLDATIAILEPQLRELFGQLTPTEINQGSMRTVATAASPGAGTTPTPGEVDERLQRLEKRLLEGSDDETQVAKLLRDLAEHVTYARNNPEKSTELVCGAAVRSIGVFSIDPSDESRRNALLAKETARLEGEAEVVRQTLGARAAEAAAEGEANAIKMVRKASKNMNPAELTIALANVTTRGWVDAASKGARIVINTGQGGMTSSLLTASELEKP
ncbi:hypothetical protein K8Q93_03425 [Candidatus Parcubacteria bacterium]|nr:hypothetical protein [Candidatus Parcubacteria bacterium]